MSADPIKKAVTLLKGIAQRKGQRITERDVAAIGYACSVILQLAEAEGKHMDAYRSILREKVDAEAAREALLMAARAGLEVAS